MEKCKSSVYGCRELDRIRTYTGQQGNICSKPETQYVSKSEKLVKSIDVRRNIDYKGGEFESIQKKGEDSIMSYVHAIIAVNRIVLASDSRSVVLDGSGTVQSFSDGFRKVEYLPLMECGIATAGFNVPDGIPVTDFLLKCDKTMEKYTVAGKLEYLAGRLSPYIPDGGVVNLACGGFEQGRAALYYTDVYAGHSSGVRKAEFMWHVNRHVLELLNDPDSGELDVGVSDPGSLLRFSDFLVRTEIELATYKRSIPNVGGPVQTLLLEHGRAKWIHELY